MLSGSNYFVASQNSGSAIEKKEDGDKLTLSANGISYEFYKNWRGLAAVNSPVGRVFDKLLKLTSGGRQLITIGEQAHTG